MLFLRLYRRIIAWLALVAMLLGALAPAVTQARVNSSDLPHWLEICSVTGMLWVQADTGEVRQERPDGRTPLAELHPECPWCNMNGGAAGLPAYPALADLPVVSASLPVVRYLDPATSAVWALAQSRAPPLAA
jgi:hypothetical protein